MGLVEELANDMLLGVVGAFAKVAVTDLPPGVDEVMRGPVRLSKARQMA
jgi:hypothetical protein